MGWISFWGCLRIECDFIEKLIPIGHTFYALLPSMYIFYVYYSTRHVHKWVFSYVTLCTKLMVILPISIWLKTLGHSKLIINWNDFLQRILQEIMKKNNTWNIRRLVDDSFVPSSKQPSVLYCKLTDFRASAYMCVINISLVHS